VLTGILWLSGCSSPTVPPAQAPDGNPRQGRLAIMRYGCGSCHTISGVPGARGRAGPPLSDFGGRGYIAGELPNNEANLIRWIQDPQAVEPGTAMPDLGVNRTDARDIAAYLYTRK
jgi:cytochrome c2